MWTATFSGELSARRWAGNAEDNNAEINGRPVCLLPRSEVDMGSRTDSLSNTLKNEGEKPRWTAQDAYILIHKCVLPPEHQVFTCAYASFRRIDSLDIRHDSEIDWKTFPDPDWNLWSPHLLQRRWMTMKRSIKGHENMTHAGWFCSTMSRIPRANLCCVGTTTRNLGCFEGEEGEPSPCVFRPFSKEKVQER